ncbi:MAG: hydrogenase 4 subunit B [Acetobacteraceae bacterium]|nr:hydrogenase 4 subunit B [Acetobacteraceae bacterium]
MAALPLLAAIVPVLFAAGAAIVLLRIGAAGSARQEAHAFALHGLCLACSALILVLAGGWLLTAAPTPQSIVLPVGLPWLGTHLRLDALSAFFLVVAGLGGTAASLFALGYAGHDPASARLAPLLPLFLGAIVLVLLAADAFTFLLAWELMSVVSWVLVLARHHEAASQRAGYVYLLMAGFGTLSLLFAFGLLAGPAGNYAFAAMRATTHPPLLVAAVLGLMLLGAGSKAGLLPLHVWLPLAHPAAPSHVSALMSGVMTKVAVYGFVRVGFDLMGVPPWWAGMVLLVLGGLTAVVGILQAMLETDLKVVLAYSTIENIGVIFAGLGLALAFKANGMEVLAALSLTAALFHVLNHALFKSMLFLAAGSVLAATGLADMERLGGLIHRMPTTTLAFLVGAVAISALPPLNGFASEWLLFQAILQSPDLPQWGLKIAAPAVGGMLALAAALAGACFVRAFGIAFLGRPRSEAASAAHEADHFSRAAMCLLGGLCVLAGVLPGFVVDALGPVAVLLAGAGLPRQAATPWLSLVPLQPGANSYNGLLLLVFIAASAMLAAWVIHRLASRRLRRGPAWSCGFAGAVPLAQYGGPGFAQPIRRVFARNLFAVREHITVPPPGSLSAARLVVEQDDPFWSRLYTPLAGAIALAAERMNALQFLTIRRYLSLVFLSLVGLLLALALWA